jgi:acyl transferase domain-containing protein
MSSGCKAASRYKARLVFVCSGMGQQWWAMGRELFAEERVYRETIERVDALLDALSGWSILYELMVSEDPRLSEAGAARNSAHLPSPV